MEFAGISGTPLQVSRVGHAAGLWIWPLRRNRRPRHRRLRSTFTRRHRHQNLARVEGSEGFPECPPRPDSLTSLFGSIILKKKNAGILCWTVV